ncbi:MAG: retropepsin-like aspartic protease [Bacteroidota bacterium]
MASARPNIESISIVLFCCLIGGLPNLLANNTTDIVIPFKKVNGLIILQAEVDGKKGNYLLDTGANAILIDGESEPDGKAVATVHGEVAMSSRKIEQFKVGTFVQRNLDAHIISLSSLKKELGLDLDGIIGGGYFMPRTMTLDFEQSTLTLTSTKVADLDLEAFSTVAFQIWNEIPVVTIEIEGKHYAFAMDSGASVHFMDQKIFAHLTSITPLNEVSKVLTVSQVTLEQNRFVLDQFKMGTTAFGGHHFLAQDFSLVNEEMDQALAGILSLSQMVREKVIFDFKQQKIYYR